MSCFFCSSFNHLSQNCNIYVSDKTRKEVAEKQDCCRFCLTKANFLHNYGSPECSKSRKCYICFSKNHHTVYCHERSEATRFFVPNIDNDLIPRFIQFFNLDEQTALIFSNPNYIEIIKSKSFKVIPNNIFKKKSLNTNIIINNFFYINHNSPIPLSSKIFKGANLNLENVVMPSEDFVRFLSPRLKLLYCKKVELTTGNINFEKILQHAPNLEIISFDQINISIDNTWPEQIIKWKNKASLRKLLVNIPGFDFNVESLATVMKVKSANHVKILLDVSYVDSESRNTVLEKLRKNMSPQFKLIKSSESDSMMKTVKVSVKTFAEHYVYDKHCQYYALEE